jgi:hypothetical protein
MLGFTLGCIGVPQERSAPQWVARLANNRAELSQAHRSIGSLDSGEGRKRELINSCCFPNTPIYLFTHASLTFSLFLFLS